MKEYRVQEEEENNKIKIMYFWNQISVNLDN